MSRLGLAALAAGLIACGGSSTGSGATAVPRPSASPLSNTPEVTISPSFAGPFVDVAQFGFRMTNQPGLGTVTYTIDSAHTGPTQDLEGTGATLDGVLDLGSSSYVQACGSNTANPEATIEVYTTSASSLHLAGGPSMWRRVGQYLLGFSPPQSDPCTDPLVGMDLAALQAMFSTAVAD